MSNRKIRNHLKVKRGKAIPCAIIIAEAEKYCQVQIKRHAKSVRLCPAQPPGFLLPTALVPRVSSDPPKHISSTLPYLVL